MTSITLTTDDIVEAFCKMLEPGVKKGVLPREDCNKYGVDVLHNKKDPSLIMFHFITADMLEVNIEMDLMKLQKDGKDYLDHLYGLLCDQTMMAREERQKADTITIWNTGSHVHKKDKKKQAEVFKPKEKTLIEKALH
jgi:hypothetical protein